MGNIFSSAPFGSCLEAVCNGRDNCVAYPTTPFYHVEWALPYNLNHIITPAAVVRPDTADDVSAFVKCAAEHDMKVQARSGGHSYGNHGLGGKDGALTIDLVNLQNLDVDDTTWHARVGGGMHLGDLSQRLHEAGGRAMAHGTCPGVGIGGHATVGGIGPASRMWGTCMDHVVEVEVVTADGSIVRASDTENEDLFFAMKGAGASFGIVTEFVVKTHPEPGAAVQYTYNLAFGSARDIAPLYADWQALAAAEAQLDRRFASELIVHALGAIVTATFYGTDDEFAATGIPDKLEALGRMDGGGDGKPDENKTVLFLDGWMAALAAAAQTEALYHLTGTPMPFKTKSVGLTAGQLPARDGIARFFDWVDAAEKGTLLWFLVWSIAGGAINDVAANATAFPLRDAVLYYDSYGIGPGETVDGFIAGAHAKMLDVVGIGPGDHFRTYAGYIDVDLHGEGEAQRTYWGSNYDSLKRLKATWDPSDVFWNPQSVRVA